MAGSSAGAGSGGKTSSGGASGAGGAAGGTTRTGGSSDAGTNLSIPVGDVAKYQSCVANEDCHILLTSCSCAAVITQVVELVDVKSCNTNNCPKGAHAECRAEKCTVVTAPDAGSGG